MPNLWDALPIYLGALMLTTSGILWAHDHRNPNPPDDHRNPNPPERHFGPLIGWAGAGLIIGFLFAGLW